MSKPASQLASSSPPRYTARSIGIEAQIDGAESDYIMTGLPEHEDGSGHGMTLQCMVAEPDGGTAETRDGQLLRVDRVGLVGLPPGPDGPALIRNSTRRSSTSQRATARSWPTSTTDSPGTV